MSRRHLCSSHALEATLDLLAITVDLRDGDPHLALGATSLTSAESVPA